MCKSVYLCMKTRFSCKSIPAGTPCFLSRCLEAVILAHDLLQALVGQCIQSATVYTFHGLGGNKRVSNSFFGCFGSCLA